MFDLLPKKDLIALEKKGRTSNQTLRDRFAFWLAKTGNSTWHVAGLLCRGSQQLDDYLEGEPVFDPQGLEKDIEDLLRRRDNDNFPFQDASFIETSIARRIWEVLDHCQESHDMGLIIGSSGLGKTKALQEYKRRNWDTIIVTASIVTRSKGAILYLVAKQLTSLTPEKSNYALMNAIIDELKEKPRLLVFDDSHFFNWELFETARTIYDDSGAGIAFLGQQSLYDHMIRSKKDFLWDQLTSRIGLHYELEGVTDQDVQLVCKGIYPNLDGRCLDYLYKRARGPGKLRTAVKILKKAVQVHIREGIALDIALLEDIDKLTTVNRGFI